ncbi:phage tail tape measure protein [Aureimonas leprariae]|uniref:Phage tail tape measure protein n=1 Tax=Plantimonas leprariae TaxID=2615207 RepID=A0A7V7PPK8_9HYPH|nr:phage tail tape measure protein [Aureimonas leprariae]KAB0679944.1 phage tail tape measure protein [Aureimonas leprariae]
MAADETYRVGIEADTSALDKALGDMTAKANAFGSAMNAAFRGAVVSGQSLDGVFRQLALRISTIALNAALKPVTSIAGGLIGQLANGVGSLFAGGAAASASVVPFAKGGVVASPSYFPNGRQIGLMGEAGAEAILPLRRGPDGRLGVATGEGGKGGGQPIVFNVTAADAASFRRSEAQIQAMLARAANRGRRGL